MVEYNIYQKYKKTSYTNIIKYDRTFLILKSKKVYVIININIYQTLV